MIRKNVKNNTSDGTTEIYRVPDLIQITHFGRDKAYALMRSKAFPSIKIGNTYIVTKDKFEEWLDSVSGKDFKL